MTESQVTRLENHWQYRRTITGSLGASVEYPAYGPIDSGRLRRLATHSVGFSTGFVCTRLARLYRGIIEFYRVQGFLYQDPLFPSVLGLYCKCQQFPWAGRSPSTITSAPPVYFTRDGVRVGSLISGVGENHKSLGHSGSGIDAEKQSLRLQLGFKRMVKQHPPELESCTRGGWLMWV